MQWRDCINNNTQKNIFCRICNAEKSICKCEQSDSNEMKKVNIQECSSITDNETSQERIVVENNDLWVNFNSSIIDNNTITTDGHLLFMQNCKNNTQLSDFHCFLLSD